MKYSLLVFIFAFIFIGCNLDPQPNTTPDNDTTNEESESDTTTDNTSEEDTTDNNENDESESDSNIATLEIIDITNYYDGNWIVAGLIQNNSTSTKKFVRLELIGKNEANQIVHDDTTYAFSSIPPNSVIPFRFLTSPANSNDIVTFIVSVDSYNTGQRGVFNYSFTNLTITEKNSVFEEYVGEITNNNDSYQTFINVGLIGYDDNQDIVFFDRTYPDNYNLESGGSSVFNFLISPHLSEQIKSYRLIGYSN